MPVLKKLLISFLVSLLLFTSSFLPLLARPASAAWYDQGPLEFYEKVYDDSNNDIFGERYTFAQVRWILFSLFIIPKELFQLASSFESTSLNLESLNKIAQTQGFSQIGTLFGFFYTNPPASGIAWVKDGLENFGRVKSAYAQSPGFGFDALKVFRPLWTISRNIAYALLTVLILVVAFAVMFRAKINPQTIVTLQSSIPKIVSVMLLITFSYAIAGFLIDLMYLSFGFIVFAIQAFGGGNLPGWQGAGAYLSGFTTGDVGTLLRNIFGKAGEGFVQLLLVPNIVGIMAWIMLIIAIALVVIITIPGINIIVIPFVLGIFFMVISFALKFFIMMATTYLSLLLNVVAGPLIILFEAVPGNKSATIGWLRSLVADILIF